MKRPDPMLYLIGNPVCFGVSFLFLALCVFQCMLGLWEWPTIAIAALFVAFTGGAYNQIRRYKLWQKEWDAMGPAEPARSLWFGRGDPKTALLGAVVVLIVWVGFLVGNGSITSKVAGQFLFSTACLALAAFLILRRRRKMKADVKRGELYVAVTVAKPVRSPSAAEAFASLPDYCHRLMRG